MTTGYQWALRNTTQQLRDEMAGLRRYANKRDAIEGDIVEVLQRCGCSVTRLDKPVDLIVGLRGVTYLIEVKSGTKGYGKSLNEAQQAFSDAWRGGPVITLRSIDDAVRFCNERTLI